MFNLKRGRRTFTAGRPPTNNLKNPTNLFTFKKLKTVLSCGGRTRTCNLRGMNPASCLCSTPRC